MKVWGQVLGAVAVATLSLGLAAGCDPKENISLAPVDPAKVQVPPPSTKADPNAPGAKPPKGGGSPPGDPSQYSR